MLFPDVTPAQWSQKYGVPAELLPCRACREPVAPRPAIMKDYAGFQYRCSCGGRESLWCVMVPSNSKTLAAWREVLRED